MGTKVPGSSHYRVLHHSPFKIYCKIVEPQQRIDMLHILSGSRHPQILTSTG
ncbi:MAG: hypothetical protein ACK6DX_00555 [Acidobacteriota bacterium]|jgi:hypothetical protein